jgi:hypothetical protein
VMRLTTDAGFTPAKFHVPRVQPTGERRGGDDVAELARYRGILEMVRLAWCRIGWRRGQHAR